MTPAESHGSSRLASPDDRATDMQEKIDDYLAFGIPYVWVVNPRTGRGYVHAAGATVELPLHELIPSVT